MFWTQTHFVLNYNALALFTFYALPSGGKSKDAVVHFQLNETLSLKVYTNFIRFKVDRVQKINWTWKSKTFIFVEQKSVVKDFFNWNYFYQFLTERNMFTNVSSQMWIEQMKKKIRLQFQKFCHLPILGNYY